MQHEGHTTDPGFWFRMQDRLRELSSDASYANWIAPLRCRALELPERRLVLVAPNPDAQAWVQSALVDRILSAAADLALPVSSVSIEVEAAPPRPAAPEPLAQRRHTRRFAAADTLWGPTQAAGGDVGFLHSFLAQVGLPRKRVTNPDGSPALWYERRSGNCALAVQAGKIDNGKEFVLQPIPYGPKPRLMLMDICTRAVQARSAEVDLEPSVRQYLAKRLGTGWGGGRIGRNRLGADAGRDGAGVRRDSALPPGVPESAGRGAGGLPGCEGARAAGQNAQECGSTRSKLQSLDRKHPRGGQL